MRQEINLLQLEPEVETPRLSFSMALFSGAIFSLFLLSVSWALEGSLEDVYADIREIEKNNQSQQQVIVRVDGVDKHQSHLKRLESQLLSKYQLWVNYKHIAKNGVVGFSRHFFHIANLSDQNISLYEIEIYDRGSRLAMKGYARKASYIPEYIDNLKQQKEFEEVAFGDLSIEKIKDHDVMRFSLKKHTKKEVDDIDVIIPKLEKIDVEKLMNMKLSNVDSGIVNMKMVDR